jgi:hypothetical protein
MTDSSSYKFWEDPEPLLSTLARLFAREGATQEVAILATSRASIEHTEYDNWDGGTNFYTLYVRVPHWLFGRIEPSASEIGQRILEKAGPILRPSRGHFLRDVELVPDLVEDEHWREKAMAWLAGENVSNQGRVRSDNLPSRTDDGLLFRSQPEINLYRALKAEGVSFAPLPVFVRGGEHYRRIEPDFVVIKDGVVLIVEVDGDTVHNESPAEAHDRTTMLLHEGALLERVNANRCDTPAKAATCARELLRVLEKRRLSR